MEGQQRASEERKRLRYPVGWAVTEGNGAPSLRSPTAWRQGNCWASRTQPNLRGDAIDQQHGAIDTGHSRLGAGRQIRAADRPVTIAEADAAGAIV